MNFNIIYNLGDSGSSLEWEKECCHAGLDPASAFQSDLGRFWLSPE